MIAKHFFQCVVEQVGGSVVGSRTVALVDIDACHKVCFGILRQFVHDMDALVVLALGVYDFHSLVFGDEYACIAYLSAHLTIERRVVEYDFVERMLFLFHLTVAQDVAFVFCIVITDEILLTLSEFSPVTVLHGGRIAGALFLLFHFLVESLHVDRVAVFAADELGEVERETVGVE